MVHVADLRDDGVVNRLIFIPNPHVRLDRSWAVPYVPLELLSAMAVAEAAGVEPALFDINHLVAHGRLEVDRRIWRRGAALSSSGRSFR